MLWYLVFGAYAGKLQLDSEFIQGDLHVVGVRDQRRGRACRAGGRAHGDLLHVLEGRSAEVAGAAAHRYTRNTCGNALQNIDGVC